MTDVQAKLDTVGERLRWAIDKQQTYGRRRGLRLFVHKLEQRPTRVRGASLQSVSAYLTDDVTAPTDFLKEAATVLRLRPEWLAFGSGHPTDASEAASSPADIPSEADGAKLFRPNRRLSAKELAKQRDAGTSKPGAPWVTEVEWLVRRFPDSAMLDENGEIRTDIRRRVSAAMFAPLRELGVELGWNTPANQDEMEDYLHAIIPPLLVIARIQRRAWEEAVLHAERSERARAKTGKSTRKKSPRRRTK